MRFETLRQEILEAMEKKPTYIREGQFVFNYIDEKYGVARDIQFEDKIDCFHDDKQIDKFIGRAAFRISNCG